ncbi:MAG: hypothetical protein RLZZ271_1383 [Pseudomonadota bacterium]|jgi:hypothetical protein
MKSNSLRAICAALAFCSPVCAFAQTGGLSSLYFEGGYSNMSLTAPSSTSASTGMHRLVLGMNLHPNLAAEETFSFNAKSDAVTRSGTPGFVKIKSITGLYLKPRITLADNKLTVFARLGYASYQTDFTTAPYVGTGNGRSFGLGISYRLSDNFSANVDYMNYFKRNGIEVKGTTVGIGYAF